MLEPLKILLGIGLRHGLTALGATDLIDDAGINNLVSSLMVAAGIIWSAWNAIKNKKAVLAQTDPDAKRFLYLTLLLIMPLIFTGCVMQSAVSFNPETGETTRYNGLALLNNASLKGLNVGKKTKTTSNLFSLEEGNNEVNVDALRALAEGAAAGAVKGAKP